MSVSSALAAVSAATHLHPTLRQKLIVFQTSIFHQLSLVFRSVRCLSKLGDAFFAAILVSKTSEEARFHWFMLFRPGFPSSFR